jgi:hypothetical protein
MKDLMSWKFVWEYRFFLPDFHWQVISNKKPQQKWWPNLSISCFLVLRSLQFDNLTADFQRGMGC